MYNINFFLYKQFLIQRLENFHPYQTLKPKFNSYKSRQTRFNSFLKIKILLLKTKFPELDSKTLFRKAALSWIKH